MKIAIIYTGEIRTIRKAIYYFKKNCLLNENYHVFSVLQNNGEEIADFVREQIGDNLKSLEMFDKNDSTWYWLRRRLAYNFTIQDSWKEYLTNSGSIIEYIQLYLAYFPLIKKEIDENFKYDYVIRIRCDCVITRPLNFDWVNYNKDDVKKIITNIMSYHNIAKLNDENTMNILMYFFGSLFDNERYKVSTLRKNTELCSNKVLKLLKVEDEDLFIDNFYKYFQKGKYMIAFRYNNIFCIKREYFAPISSIGVCFGLNNVKTDDIWFFNSESQLSSRCIENNIDFYSTVTVKEDKSLYEYNPNDYFEEDGTTLLQNDDVYYFLLRR